MRVTPAVLALLTIGCSVPDGRDVTDLEEPGSAVRLEVSLGEPFTLSPDQTAEISQLGLAMRFLEVASDSRCPVDVDCVWEGDAEVVVAVTEGDRERTHRLHAPGERIGPRGVDLLTGHRLELVELGPAPVSDRPISPEAYRATFRITADQAGR